MSIERNNDEGFQKWLEENHWHIYGPQNPKNPMYDATGDIYVNWEILGSPKISGEELYADYMQKETFRKHDINFKTEK